MVDPILYFVINSLGLACGAMKLGEAKHCLMTFLQELCCQLIRNSYMCCAMLGCRLSGASWIRRSSCFCSVGLKRHLCGSVFTTATLKQRCRPFPSPASNNEPWDTAFDVFGMPRPQVANPCSLYIMDGIKVLHFVHVNTLPQGLQWPPTLQLSFLLRTYLRTGALRVMIPLNGFCPVHCFEDRSHHHKILLFLVVEHCMIGFRQDACGPACGLAMRMSALCSPDMPGYLCRHCFPLFPMRLWLGSRVPSRSLLARFASTGADACHAAAGHGAQASSGVELAAEGRLLQQTSTSRQITLLQAPQSRRRGG